MVNRGSSKQSSEKKPQKSSWAPGLGAQPEAEDGGLGGRGDVFNPEGDQKKKKLTSQKHLTV